jgi:two-component system CheB/CheR fusion protein
MGALHIAVIKGEVGRIAEIAQRALAKYRETRSPESVSVGAVIESVLDLYKPRFETNGIGIIWQHEFQGSIQADPTQMREVFANLFLNAIDAMNRGGRLRIRLSEGREWRGQHRHGVHILVADNGCGVAPEHLNKIFEPSFTTKGERGNGIGLSVVRDVIRGHRGTIRVRSGIREGRSGTIFSIFLPGEKRSELAAA